MQARVFFSLISAAAALSVVSDTAANVPNKTSDKTSLVETHNGEEWFGLPNVHQLSQMLKTYEYTDEKGQYWRRATTTRYWDCSYQHCTKSMGKKYKGNNQCEAPKFHDDANPNCQGDEHHQCASSSLGLFEVNGKLFGTAAASTSVGVSNEQDMACGKCYRMKVHSGKSKDKELTLMVTNWCPECAEGKAPLGADSGRWHFDIAVPGGGQGLAPRCLTQYPNTTAKTWETVPKFASTPPTAPTWHAKPGMLTKQKREEADKLFKEKTKEYNLKLADFKNGNIKARSQTGLKNCENLPSDQLRTSCKLWYSTFGDENLGVDFHETPCPAELHQRFCD